MSYYNFKVLDVSFSYTIAFYCVEKNLQVHLAVSSNIILLITTHD